jgi:hypothetical protein
MEKYEVEIPATTDRAKRLTDLSVLGVSVDLKPRS